MLAAGCEAALAVIVLLLTPVLAVLPRGAAALAAAAGLCAAGLAAARPPDRFPPLAWPATLFGGLLVWGALSALWSIDPGRSLALDARLAGMIACGLALAAASDRLAAPRRLVGWLLAGLALGSAIGLVDFATAGAVTRLVSIRPFHGPRLNQFAVGLAILTLPVAAMLRARGHLGRALAAGAIMAAIVFGLEGSAPKLSLGAGLAVGALAWWRPRSVCRALAAGSIASVLAAPLVLPRLDTATGVFAAADRFKDSAGHRLVIWNFTGARIAERPLLGWGLDAARAIPGGKEEFRPGQSRLPLHPHDAALQAWLELGLPGAALFGSIVAMLWLAIAAAQWPRIYAAAAAGALAAALVAASGAYGIWQEWWVGTLALATFLIRAMARTVGPAVEPAIPPPPGSPGGDR